MRPINRITPNMPVGAYQTYGIAVPLRTHWRGATCAEVDCRSYQNGWATRVLPGSDDEALLLRAADGAVDGHRRRYVTQPDGDGFVRYVFYAEQPCFAAGSHRVRADRPEIYTVRGGDWRAATSDVRTFDRHDQWVDHFATNQDRVKTAQERG